MPSAAEVFARTVRALQPYAGDVVFIGGWVHALYLAEANADDRPVATDDIDITLPHRLLTAGRPALLELVEAAGYEINEVFPGSGEMEIFQPGPGAAVIELDLLTEAPDPREDVLIEGQPGLKVHGYPGQHVLLENARWIEVGPDVHPSLDPPVAIRVPTIAAYVLGKGLSSRTRTRLRKEAKDLVYLYEIARHPGLGAALVAAMPELAGRYPAEYAAWRDRLAEVVTSRPILSEMAEQLLAGSRSVGREEDIARVIVARIQRLLGETPPAA